MSVVEHSYTKAVASLTAGHFYAIGPGGDSDPVWALEDAVFVNKGTTDLRVGHSLTGILSGTNYQTVIAGTSTPLAGVLDNLLVYNPEAATAGVFSVTATGRRRNSGQDAGVLCAEGSSNSTTRFQIIRPSRTAGSTISTTVPVKYQRLLTTIKGYSVSVPSGGTLTIGLLDSRGRSLLTAVMDQEALTTLTLYTATTLVGTLGSLTIAQGDNLTLSAVSSAGGDTLGDILIELAHTVA
jgi:hypothetical protein